MFVDAISFSSAHVIKIKDQTIVIPAKKLFNECWVNLDTKFSLNTTNKNAMHKLFYYT